MNNIPPPIHQSYYPPVNQPIAQPSIHTYIYTSSTQLSSQQLTTASLILSLTNTSLYTLKQGSKQLKCVGVLQLMSVCDDDSELDNTLIIVLNSSDYTFISALNDAIPIINMGNYNYVLPVISINGSSIKTFGIVIDTTQSHNTTDTIKLFDALLIENCDYKISSIQYATTVHDNTQPINNQTNISSSSLPTAPSVDLNESLSVISHPSPDHVVTASDYISRGINNSAQLVVKGIYLGSLLMSAGIKKSSDYIKSRHADSAPAQSHTSSSTVQNRMHTARTVSNAAVSVSQSLMAISITASNTLSTYLSDYISTTELAHKIQQSNNPRDQALKQLANSTISSIVTIYQALETAGMALLTNSSNAVVEVLSVTHGDYYSSLARDAGDVLHNTARIAVAARQCTITAVAKSAIKSTTIQVLNNPTATQQQIAQQAINMNQLNSVHQPVNPDHIDPIQTFRRVHELQQRIAGRVNNNNTSAISVKHIDVD